MAQTSSSTQYGIYLQDSTNGQFGSFVLSSDVGADDASVLALAQNLKGFAWPSAMGAVTVQVTKTDDTTTSYTGNLNTTPPAFS